MNNFNFKIRKRVLIGAAIIFGGFILSAIARSTESSIVPNGRTAPDGFVAPGPVRAIVQKACLDCHSNATIWPWYSHVPVISSQIRDDVTNGREVINFSNWQDYSPEERRMFASEIAHAVRSRAMPPSKYIWIHPEARLSEADREVLQQWARGDDKK